ncbi:MAG: SDR family oxidoreductase [Flammeovirgaceae bacterium]|jgi:NAD(P)-dependent dehydrogenase (short-subunit alcohol dehydrogenase family)|nr:SDR family oxidoreductase [Flammeovirgaceae bacterium]
MKRLKNKTVFITGGLSGIGKACAVAAAREGGNVVVGDIKSVNLDGAMKEIQAENESAVFFECDASDLSSISAAVDFATEKFKTLDVALNNAGVGGDNTSIAVMTEEDWNSVLRVNLTGVFYCMKKEIEVMATQKSGVVVNMASILGKVGFSGSSAYVAAKHGVLGLTKTAALEYATCGIRVNAISPGFINTPLLTKGGINGNDTAKQQIVSMHPINRLGKPEEIADAFIFLASAQSSFITGTTLDVDGGYLSR